MAMADRGFWLGLFYGPHFYFRYSDSFVVPFLFTLTRPCLLRTRGTFKYIAYKVVYSPISCPHGQHIALGLITFNILNSLFLDLFLLILSRSIIS